MISYRWLRVPIRPRLAAGYTYSRGFLSALSLTIFVLLLAGCITDRTIISTREALMISLTADGKTFSLTTEASNVRELLEEAGVEISDIDLVDPPPFTPLSDEMQITVVRVTESIEIIEQSVPFQRRIVRNESMSADDPPLIIQNGKPGLQEITVRIVYRNDLEYSRQETQVTEIEPTVDEIVMIGVGVTPGNVNFPGLLAFIRGGNSVIMRGSSLFPEQINTGGELDHRVFSLSPSGNYLLYTRISTDTESFNTLWVVSTDRGATPRPLGETNILWADWNPARVGQPEIAFTTGIPTELLPGWEANNDLWIGDVPLSDSGRFRPERLVESYPATYGWWGGNYAWSPGGRYIAYAYADEIGVIDTQADEDDELRIHLQSFTEFNTRGDWVWVPSLSWSPDDNYLIFTRHGGADPDAVTFDTWVIDIGSKVTNRFVDQSGIWSHPQWSPVIQQELAPQQSNSQIAFLRATNPLESQRSSYTLWLMDQDGSNTYQLYPAAGENSRFPRERRFMAWGPTGRQIAFIYDSSLYMLDLASGEIKRLTQGESPVSNPTWAPYGSAELAEREVPGASTTPIPETPVGGKLPLD